MQGGKKKSNSVYEDNHCDCKLKCNKTPPKNCTMWPKIKKFCDYISITNNYYYYCYKRTVP